MKLTPIAPRIFPPPPSPQTQRQFDRKHPSPRPATSHAPQQQLSAPDATKGKTVAAREVCFFRARARYRFFFFDGIFRASQKPRRQPQAGSRPKKGPKSKKKKQEKKQEKAKRKRSSGATNTPPLESNDDAPQPAKETQGAAAEIRNFRLNQVAPCLPLWPQGARP